VTGFQAYRLKFIACCLLLLALPAVALAHPIHSSLAEADYNRTTQKLEVALRVFADDFELALTARAKTKITLERTSRTEFDALARAYLAERFTLKSAAGAPIAFTYLGRDYKDAANELWFFFEFQLPSGPDNATLHHAVLADHFGDQLNSVHLRDADRRLTLVFLAKHGPKRIRFRP